MPTELRTPRLLVRSLREDDRDEFVRVHVVSEELFRAWSPAYGGSPGDLFEIEMTKVREGAANGRYHRMVGVMDDGRIAGFFNLGEVARGFFQSAYAGWSVNAEVARQGYGTEGVEALLDLAFAADGLALHRVQANVIPDNEPSLRLAARVGFRREGLAERYLAIAGEWRDHVMFAKTVEEHRFRHRPA